MSPAPVEMWQGVSRVRSRVGTCSSIQYHNMYGTVPASISALTAMTGLYALFLFERLNLPTTTTQNRHGLTELSYL